MSKLLLAVELRHNPYDGLYAAVICVTLEMKIVLMLGLWTKFWRICIRSF